MRKKEFEKIHRELQEEKVEILNRLMKDRANYYENLKNEGGDLADEAMESIEREIIYDLSIAEKKELEEINTAIKKLEEGTYGVCEMCDKDIPIERLKVKPYAKFCTHCREIDERKKKNHVMSEENE
ncbi:MAG: TraR/DksA C4-type zinc finger protein [Spirochaetes bacterium]|nr:TraR/DksA C4-type zinc finger protein [Spirochaetota bacterium]